MQNQIKDILKHNPIVPVVLLSDDKEAIEMCKFIIDSGIKCIEVTLRNEYAIKGISLIKKEFGDSLSVGAGTVCTPNQVELLQSLEIDFMVSPGINRELIQSFNNSGVAYLPGTSTPSEMILAMELGLETLKFFPAELFGGIKALKTYSSVFPSLGFCPTGGISKSTYKQYLQLKNVISVGGSWIQLDFKNLNRK